MPQFDPRKAETPKTSLPTGNPQAPKFLDQVANACRLKRLSYRTEQAYVSWAKRFIRFHNKRHPNEMGEQEIEAFLTHLTRNRGVAASTQNQESRRQGGRGWSASRNPGLVALQWQSKSVDYPPGLPVGPAPATHSANLGPQLRTKV